MGCCGQGRTKLQSTALVVPRKVITQHGPESRTLPRDTSLSPAPLVRGHSGITLRYLERSPILVQGSVTGQHYRFSETQPIQVVDRRDAESLLRTRFFRRNV